MANSASEKIEKNTASSVTEEFRRVVSDAFAFVRSAETNQALSTVTLDLLIEEQIKRNGESAKSKAAKYSPYAIEPDKPTPAGVQPVPIPIPGQSTGPVGASVSDTGRPTKIDRILAVQNSLSKVVEKIKSTPVWDVITPE